MAQGDGLMQPLVVTTSHYFVFFGYGEPSDGPTIRLERARICVSWPETSHGLTGLAQKGPLKGSRIGPAAPAVTLRDVTLVLEATDAAAHAWEAEPWN